MAEKQQQPHLLPHPARVIGLGATVYGIGMTLGPADGFRSATYETAFDLIGRRAWGLMFLTAGLSVVLAMRERTAQLLAGVLAMWAAAITWETAHQYITNGQANSIVAPVWAIVAATGLLAIVEWFGLDDE